MEIWFAYTYNACLDTDFMSDFILLYVKTRWKAVEYADCIPLVYHYTAFDGEVPIL